MTAASIAQAGGLICAQTPVFGELLWEGPWWVHDAAARQAVRHAVECAARGHVNRTTVATLSDGRPLVASLTVAPLRSPDGRIVRLNAWVEELTQPQPDRGPSVFDALAESEERFRLATEAMSGLVYDWTPALGQVRRSAALHALLGFLPEEVEPTSDWWRSRMHPDDMARCDAVASAALRNRARAIQCEYRVRHRDGHYIWVLDNSRVSYGPDGQVQRLLGCTISIDDRKRSEEALRLSEQRFRLAHQAARVGSFEWNIIDNINIWSVELEALYGLAPGEFDGTYEAWLARVHPDDRESAVAAVRSSMSSGRLESEWRVIRPDGVERWLAARAVVTFDDAGRPARMSGINMDVTEQRRVETALRESQETLRLALRSADLGMWVIEFDTRAVIWDPRATEIIGADPPDALELGQALEGVVHPEDRNVVEMALARAVDPSGEGRYEAEHRIIRASGEVRWVVGVGRVTFEQHGNEKRPLTLTGIVQDITDRRTAQEELRAAVEAAEQANRAKDEFIAALSHELRTPLTPVLLSVDSMREASDLPDWARSEMQMICRNIQIEARLIDDLLDLTRIARGKLQLEMTVVDLHETLRDAVRNSVEPDALQPRIELDFMTEPLAVLADGARLQQIFWNLIKNALKFTPPDGVVTVSTRAAEGWAVVTVKDNGIGIEAELLPRLFTAFNQGSIAATRRLGGLGLGLAICKALTDVHGGTIRAHSEGVGAGASFVVRLPLSRQPAPGRDAPAGPSATRDRGLRILLVEDHEATGRVMHRLLASFGHNVEWATNVAEAMRIAGGGRFDLVVSDLGLPDGTGHELMRSLRDRHGLRGIALSGFGTEQDQRRSHEAGFVRHLTKPIEISRLSRVIDEAASVGST